MAEALAELSDEPTAVLNRLPAAVLINQHRHRRSIRNSGVMMRASSGIWIQFQRARDALWTMVALLLVMADTTLLLLIPTPSPQWRRRTEPRAHPSKL